MTAVAMSTQNAQILVSKYSSPFKGTRTRSLEKGLISRRDKGKSKMNLGYLVMPESKEVLKDNRDIAEEHRN